MSFRKNIIVGSYRTSRYPGHAAELQDTEYPDKTATIRLNKSWDKLAFPFKVLRLFWDYARGKEPLGQPFQSFRQPRAALALAVAQSRNPVSKLHYVFWTPVFTGVTASAITDNMLSEIRR
jgi:hypothetical protein